MANRKLSRIGACLAVAMIAAQVLVPTTARALEGGRITLQPFVRMSDTRQQGSPVTNYPLPANSLLHVFILSSTGSPGQPLTTAAVHPCGQPVPAGAATFILRPEEFVDGAKVVTGSVATCVTSTLPVHVIIDVSGSVATQPAQNLLQYVPITPTVVFDGPVAAGSTSTMPRAAGVSADARGVVVQLEALSAERSGFMTGFNCAGPRPLRSDLQHELSRSVNLAYVDFPVGGATCVYSLQAAAMRITVLGYFSLDGPDPTALPPSFGFTTGDVAPPGLRAITPVRVLDTRSGIGRPGTAKVPARGVVQLSFGSQVASTTASVVLNVTVTEPDASGFLTAYPCDRPRPEASNLNFVRGQDVPNLVVVKLAVDRTICLYSQSPTHLIADLTGTFEADGGARGRAVVPSRILDTRETIGVTVPGKLVGGQTLTLQVSGRGDVPPTGATAATLNVTATESEGPGFVTVWPCDRDRPTTSNLNHAAGETVPNLVTTKLSATGTVCLFAQTTTHLIADVGMWFGNDEPVGFKEVVPERLLDTRQPIGVAQVAKIAPLGVVRLQVADRGGVPAVGAQAVALNITVTEPEGAGFVTAWPCDEDMPVVSNLNFVNGETVPNAATVKLSAVGLVCLFTTTRAHLLADVTGYFTAVPDTGFVVSLGPS